MESTLNSKKLKAEFSEYLRGVFLKNLNFILGAGILILCYYAYSDLSVRHNVWAAATRLFPLGLLVVILVLHLAFPHKLFKTKKALYILAYMALQLMMYGKCLIHLHEPALAPSVTGAILIVFIISLDIKQSNRLTALIYAIPIAVFTLLLVFVGKPTSEEFFVMADIYPIVIMGFAINRTQFKLRFKLFKANRLLSLEQDKTKALYNETLQVNQLLKKKASEAVLIKEEIQLKNKELNKSNATKDRFLAIIAHDLKNPIGAIWGLSDLLLLDDSIDEERKQSCMEMMNKSIKNTYKLLENLLTWARAQNKAIVHEPVVQNMNEALENELMVLRQVADKKSIHIENNVGADINVYVDQNMFETIVRNLISNAIKYSYNNGKISIDASQVNNNGKSYTEISIADNGVGMSQENLSKLFTINETMSTKGTDNEKGTGLGLLLCKEFVELHNGAIDVESEPNKGSVFRCRFPLCN